MAGSKQSGKKGQRGKQPKKLSRNQRRKQAYEKFSHADAEAAKVAAHHGATFVEPTLMMSTRDFRNFENGKPAASFTLTTRFGGPITRF